MSSTNRSKARNNHISDYYVTPVEEIIKFLEEYKKLTPFPRDYKFLDPCAGGDANHPMSYPEAFKRYGMIIDTIDIRQDSLADIKADYLTTDCKGRYDCIITNPPFSIALDIVKKALDDVKDDGMVIMLLRLNFFGSKDRKDFWKEHMPDFTFVHHKRMSFTGKGTDSIEYCHMVWRKREKTWGTHKIFPYYTRLVVI